MHETLEPEIVIPAKITNGDDDVEAQAAREYLKTVWERYKAATRSEKGAILDEVVKNLGIHRGSAKRLLSRRVEPRSKQGRGKRSLRYGDEVRKNFIRLWRSMGCMGARRTIAACPRWLPYYSHSGCSLETRTKLLEVKRTTADAWIAPERAKDRRARNTGTKRTLRLRKRFPTAVKDTDVDGPGHFQVDSVSHGGDSASGQYAWSINATDVASGWTETFAVWHKQSTEVVKGLKDIEDNLPFKLKSLRFDNGTEFITEVMHEEFVSSREAASQVKLYRSRPYKKNDQCFIEQKNDDIVRRLFGYDRIDDKQMISVMNHAYILWNHLHNAFVPQQKITEKMRTGAKVRKKYDDAKTPVERLLETPMENVDQRQRLLDLVDGVNPFDLRRRAIGAARRVYTFLFGDRALELRGTG